MWSWRFRSWHSFSFKFWVESWIEMAQQEEQMPAEEETADEISDAEDEQK